VTFAKIANFSTDLQSFAIVLGKIAFSPPQEDQFG
jgi:hypothetical protein